MKVSEAIMARRSVRAFTGRPVDEALIRRLVALAGRAPSGGNLQPWRLFLLKGERLTQLKATMGALTVESPQGEGGEYAIYPPGLVSPYSERRLAVGEALYATLGVARDDRAGRRRQFGRNFQFFDAPLALFCYVDRSMGPAQWSDLGMYLQSLMLLLKEEGLDSCPQECWAMYPRTVSALLGAPPELMLFAGMAIGYADAAHPVNGLRAERAAPSEYATFIGFQGNHAPGTTHPGEPR